MEQKKLLLFFNKHTQKNCNRIKGFLLNRNFIAYFQHLYFIVIVSLEEKNECHAMGTGKPVSAMPCFGPT